MSTMLAGWPEINHTFIETHWNGSPRVLIQLSPRVKQPQRDRYPPAGKQIIIPVVEHAYRLVLRSPPATFGRAIFAPNEFTSSLSVKTVPSVICTCRKQYFYSFRPLSPIIQPLFPPTLSYPLLPSFSPLVINNATLLLEKFEREKNFSSSKRERNKRGVSGASEWKPCRV